MGIHSIIVVLISIKLLVFVNSSPDEGIKCAGYCTSDPEKCKLRGGRISGLCTNALACCDPLVSSVASCGDVKTGQRIIDFKSPGYPTYSKGDLNCNIKIQILKDNIATRIDFLNVEMDGPAFTTSDETPGSCESDMILIRGFGSWGPTPRCGNFSGYSFLIDRESPQVKSMQSLSLLALMASLSYRWHIRVVQLLKRKSTFTHNSENNAIDDYEMTFKAKRSLLTPIARRFPDNDAEETIISEETSAPPPPTESRPSTLNTGNADDSLKTLLILSGESTVISSVPWQVSFRFKLESLTNSNGSYMSEVIDQIDANCSTSEGFHFCGGSIIGERYILSAAHCFFSTSKTRGMVDLKSIKAVVGDSNLCTDDSEKELASFDHDVESITIHYAYDGQQLINDIAVVKLKSAIKFKSHIQPIKLTTKGDDFSSQEAIVSGWGDYLSKKSNSEEVSNSTTKSTNEDDFILAIPDELQYSKKFVIQNKSVCNARDVEEYYSSPIEIVTGHMKYFSVFNSTLCTLGKMDNVTDVPVSTGKGDSGGPLVVYRTNKSQSKAVSGESGTQTQSPVLVGVVSFGIEDNEYTCNKNDYNNTFDYFSSVPFFRSWIDLAILSCESDPMLIIHGIK